MSCPDFHWLLLSWEYMPSHEGPPIHREGTSSKEQEPVPYHLTAHYTDEQAQDSARAYSQAQRLIDNPGILLSAYRLELPPIAPGWFVAVLGETPPEEIQAQLLAILSTGEPATLPDNVMKYLEKRR